MEESVQDRWAIHVGHILATSLMQNPPIHCSALRDLLRRFVLFQETRQGRFIHIVPQSVNALLQQHFTLITPPLPYSTLRKIGEDAESRPDAPLEQSAIRVATEHLLLHTLLIDLILIIYLDAWIENSHKMKPLFMQRLNHLRRIGKGFGIPGKITIAAHVVNIQPDCIAGMLTCTQALSDIQHFFR